MDVAELAKHLSNHFVPFSGGAETLLRDLFNHPDTRSLADVPSRPEAFRLALTTIAPDLLALGVSVKVAPGLGGLITIMSASDAQKEEQSEAELRASYFSRLPEADARRAEFGNSEAGFARLAGYRRGLRLGVIREPFRRPNVIDQEDKGPHAQVDATLPLEQQLLERWNHEPHTRKSFMSVESFVAYEKARARGLVRKQG
jgi:hypothetical protein